MSLSLPLDPTTPPHRISKSELLALQSYPDVIWQIADADQLEDFVLELYLDQDEDEEPDAEEGNEVFVTYVCDAPDFILSVAFAFDGSKTRILDDITYM